MSFMLLVTMTQNVEALTPPAPGIELTETEAKCLSKTSDALAIGKLLSPKMQIFCGTLLENVKCNDGLELIFKSTDGSPACVKPKTAEKLIERGWAFETSSIDSYDDCVAAGNDVLEWLDEEGGWGRHCYTPDGKKFVVDCNKFLASCT